MKRSKRLVVLFAVCICLLGFAGCRRPYDTPEFVTIEASQTAFLVPLTGDTSNQASFESEELLEQAKVATKEIQIPHRWVQTGRRNWQGEWRASAKLIIVERKPVSRSWESGDSAAASANKAIFGETSDAIGVYVGMNCSAQINEEDATKFLYRYNNTPLETIIDTDIKKMVEDEFNMATGKYASTELHSHKEEIMNTVKTNVVAYFKEYGITITVLGMKEGISFENPSIQAAIDEKYASEQDLAIQQNKNAAALAKAEADAEAAIIAAEAEAKILEIAANAEAEANRKIAESLTGELLDLKLMEAYTEKWNGDVPMIQGETNSIMDISSILSK